jgi:hypothetical protein
MESNTPMDPHHGSEAQRALEGLDVDRAMLAERIATPWSVHALLAMLAAVFVALPAIGSDRSRNTMFVVVFVVMLAVFAGAERRSRVRRGRPGAPAIALAAGLVVAILVLFSVSLALAASLSAWWVALPALACFAIVLAGSRGYDRLSRKALRHGH